MERAAEPGACRSCAGIHNWARHARRTRQMRAARVQPRAGLREKRLEGRRPPTRTGYALVTTVTIILAKVRAFPPLSQAIIVNGSGQAQCYASFVGNRDFGATRRRQRALIGGLACVANRAQRC